MAKIREYKKQLALKIVKEFNGSDDETSDKVDKLSKKYHLSISTIYGYIRKNK